jgi:cellulose synthase/poly-beta-1,6-N-acetylglucosamine synthase-like glycosyltransferase
MFLVFLGISLFLYLIQSALIPLGIRRLRRFGQYGIEPSVTIIVAARNEEEHIGSCIDSLVTIDYPHEKLEIVIVDDRSTDTTASIISSYSQRYPFLKTFTAEPSDSHLKGKANAVAQAIDRSSGEIILQTDADCTVTPEWVRETVSRYSPETGLVGGYTLLRSYGWFGAIQALDWIYLFNLAAAGIGWKKPLTVVGNHLTYRRKTYNDVGGYRSIKFSVTEDYALVRAVNDKTDWKFGFSTSASSLVTSLPCSTAGELYRQRVRWGVGGLEMKFRGFAIMAIGFILHSLFLLGIFLTSRLDILLGAFIIKAAADAIVLFYPLHTFNAVSLLRYIIHFEIYFILYVIILPFAVLFHQNIKWKGRTF